MGSSGLEQKKCEYFFDGILRAKKVQLGKWLVHSGLPKREGLFRGSRNFMNHFFLLCTIFFLREFAHHHRGGGCWKKITSSNPKEAPALHGGGGGGGVVCKKKKGS